MVIVVAILMTMIVTGAARAFLYHVVSSVDKEYLDAVRKVVGWCKVLLFLFGFVEWWAMVRWLVDWWVLVDLSDLLAMKVWPMILGAIIG